MSSTNRRSFLARGAALAAVPTVAALAGGVFADRASADTLPKQRANPAIGPGSRRQLPRLLRGAGEEEPVLGHRRRLPGGFPDHP